MSVADKNIEKEAFSPLTEIPKKPASDPIGKPVSRDELQTMMVSDYRRAYDITASPEMRFVSLLNASNIAQSLASGGNRQGIPAQLLDNNSIRQELNNFGQMGLAQDRHRINSSIGRPEQSDRLVSTVQSVRDLIGLMAENGLQTEDQSYALLGGREHLARLEQNARVQRSQFSAAENTNNSSNRLQGEEKQPLPKQYTPGINGSAYTAITPPTGKLDFDFSSNALSGNIFKSASAGESFTLVDAREPQSIIAADKPILGNAPVV